VKYNSANDWTVGLTAAADAILPLGEGPARLRVGKIERLRDALWAVHVGAPFNEPGVKVDYTQGTIVVKFGNLTGGKKLGEKLKELGQPFFEEITVDEPGDGTSIVTIKYSPKPGK
jgi:hypothetical protein